MDNTYTCTCLSHTTCFGCNNAEGCAWNEGEGCVVEGDDGRVKSCPEVCGAVDDCIRYVGTDRAMKYWSSWLADNQAREIKNEFWLFLLGLGTVPGMFPCCFFMKIFGLYKYEPDGYNCRDNYTRLVHFYSPERILSTKKSEKWG